MATRVWGASVQSDSWGGVSAEMGIREGIDVLITHGPPIGRSSAEMHARTHTHTYTHTHRHTSAEIMNYCKYIVLLSGQMPRINVQFEVSLCTHPLSLMGCHSGESEDKHVLTQHTSIEGNATLHTLKRSSSNPEHSPIGSSLTEGVPMVTSLPRGGLLGLNSMASRSNAATMATSPRCN